MAGVGEEHSSCVYLDYNATTPIFPEVAEAMKPYLTEFGNPSSNHPYGRKCKQAVELARQQVARLINAQPSEIYFCSCGTEADNWAIWGAIVASRAQNPMLMPHVVTSAIEHPAILEQLKMLQGLGLVSYTTVGVNSEGIVNVTDLLEALETPSTRPCLLTIMHSNNEVGSLQPIAEVAKLAQCTGILVHSDAAQSIGKVPVDVKQLGVDMLTLVGHKFGAPKGVAALYIKDGVSKTKVSNFLCGGGQENGRRAGTENVLLIVGLGKAAEIAYNELERTKNHMAYLRNELQRLLKEQTPEGLKVQVNGPIDPQLRLPNTLSISFNGISSSQLLSELSEEVAASAGAACHSSNSPVISSVLAAMQVPNEYALGTLRLSVGRHTTEEDVKRGADLIIKKVADLRNRTGYY
ncbi:hypothetical protein Ndes2526A_g01318 [Nannochloris sp. 'desiccata']|nr:hypothetical protein KSW81_004329 [Chlorella desiccata (nom. nud.)]